tara:strand:+ start:1716 stop:2645 length:930 start_codon:yes stop_codon:yes gene_type:complete
MKNKKIYISGHNGMVGSAVLRNLSSKGFNNLIYKSFNDLDLRNEIKTDSFFQKEKPEIVIMAAAKVGGILANNNFPYQFLYENLKIQNNVINSSLEHGVEKLIFLGSSCIYPKYCDQPIKEEYLLTGALEPTNQWYAIAKIAGLKLVDAIINQYKKNFISLMPTNLYGPNDNFDLNSSHVLPALIRKFHEAKTHKKPFVTLWGSGFPKREFLHVDDLAETITFCIQNQMDESLYNVGSGQELSIKDLAILIKSIVKFDGEIKWDSSKPDGTPRKFLDSSKLEKLNSVKKINLKTGIRTTYDWFKKNYKV